MRVAATHEAGWERVMAEASKDSWKDEAWTIIYGDRCDVFHTAVAAIYVERLHCAKSTPQWFQWAMYASIAASWTPWYQGDQEVNVEKLINDLKLDEGCKFEIYNDHLDTQHLASAI